MARRIVPELISPSQAVAVQPAFESVAEQPLNLRFDLKEQAELAKTMLEPGRKIFVDISQDSKVNWRKLQKAAGVQKAKPQHKTAPALSVPTDKAQPFQVPVGRGGGSNIFASVVERLEAGLAMPHEPDSDDSASEPNERPANPDSESDGDSDGGNNEFAEYDDEFIDDSEFHEYYGGDWHKPKHSGFFINQGDIEKTDVLLMSDEPGPEPRKRRTKPKQSKPGSPAKSPVKPGAVRQVMGKDGKMKQVRMRKLNPDGTPVVWKTKASGEAIGGAKPPKPANRPASAGPHSTQATAATVPAGATEGHANNAVGLISPAAAFGSNPGHPRPAEAPQQHVALTPEEDKIPLAMMAGVTPAKPPKALTESLPASPVAGLAPQPPAQARTPQTGKKRSREGAEGIGGYVIPSDVRSLLDQLKDLAENLGLPKEEGAEEAATQPAEEKLQKKLPPQLNPLLAKLARAAARENEKTSGARTTIANAAYSFLHPWTQKGNMAVRLKKLHESAQARHEKSRDGLITSVAQQQPVLTGGTAPSLVGSNGDFAALPGSSQQPAASTGTAAAGSSSSLAWNKMQEFALHEYVTAVLELQGGRDDNPRLWEDVAASPGLWGPNKVTPAELKEVYLRTKPMYSQPEGESQPKKRPRKARPLSGNVDTIRASSTLDEALGKKFLAQEPPKSQPPSESASPSPPKPSAPPAQASTAPGPPAEPLQQPQAQAAGQLASCQPGALLLERQPQLWPSSGNPLASVPQHPGQKSMPGEGQAVPSAAHPAGALQAQAAPLMAQPSDSLSQQAHPTQGDAEATPTAPSKEEFLQFGVDHGGDRELLSRGLYACKEGTIKEITYKVLLHAGPVGLKVSSVVQAAKAMGLVASDWVSNKSSRSSQISNAIRHTDIFTHVGDHRYAIAGFPGVQHVPLKPQQGKRSGEKPAALEDTETKHEFVPTTASPLEAHVSILAAPSSAAVRETHNSNILGMAAAPAMAPILPVQAPLPHDATQLPPVLIAALNQINQGQAQQGLPAIESLQSLLQPSTDRPVQQPPLFQHPQS
ncbi:hypothetical protein WJX77_004600 [Trebouxia sp. C0004]